MAVHFYMAISGDTHATAEQITTYFRPLRCMLPDGLEVLCDTSIQQDGVGSWWSVIYPTGMALGLGGPVLTAAQRKEVGFLLYTQLRSAPPVFKYAIFGDEVLDAFFDGMATWNWVEHDPAPLTKGWPGLVIPESLWAQINTCSLYVPFRPGYVWHPYEGDAWG